ncbi:flagellar biosynthesis anti-sigma factor FlgM [Candidatus Methylobacter oryzae]|uniref:Negative regulator of flagellin synthesis n=1 Tax=Candidatus Methylobacter oryzae TaxID=2497749 RepID=A0ABY3C8Q7_9GAMM|nr:flagellar biosynthesis anti-sigma factor FlgM [Candidatus Methylobacter oryzae]TRW93022.1 flagellar biosynthesis anti-sigma factor FlgM [Candidatus Methylobacter oryzae]
MAIEITGRTSGLTTISPPLKSGVDAEKKVAVANTEESDSVALTATTQEIKKTLSSSSSSPVDVDRVNAIKKSLADGSYSINAEQVAKKFMQFERLMP